MSLSHLCHQFKKRHRRTVTQEIRRLRIRWALDMLATSDLLIKEVAATVGYGNMSYRAFSKAFRAETGISPREFRDDVVANGSNRR